METRKKSLGRRIREEKTSYLMLLPNLIMFVVFTIYPHPVDNTVLYV